MIVWKLNAGETYRQFPIFELKNLMENHYLQPLKRPFNCKSFPPCSTKLLEYLSTVGEILQG